MTKTYTQCVSGDNLSFENIYGIIIIKLQYKEMRLNTKRGVKCSPSYMSLLQGGRFFFQDSTKLYKIGTSDSHVA